VKPKEKHFDMEKTPIKKDISLEILKLCLTKLHGKELSYNNLLDVDAAVNLMNEFHGEQPTFAILKHNNACGFAQRDTYTRPMLMPWQQILFLPLEVF